MNPTARHADADTSAVCIERSDAIDAAAALTVMAEKYRRDATSRRWSGPHNKQHRAWLRDAAKVYDAAARRVQHAADDAL